MPAFATLVQNPNNGSWTLQSIWCPAAATAGPDLPALRGQVLRLLPRIGIGTAPRATTLVNIQTVVWAATPARRDLGTVRVVGQSVRLRIDIDHATWDFGDGHTDTTSTPGAPYDPEHNPCRTAQCPGYYGHSYTRTGPATIRLTIAWHAAFSLDGATWTDVDPAPLAGPTAATPIRVREARSVLVPDPH